MIRVVVAEDQSMVLGALAALLEIERDIEVVGRARDGREALDLVASESPDVLLADIEMPRLSGLEVAATVTSRYPSTRVVILTMVSPRARAKARKIEPMMPVRAKGTTTFQVDSQRVAPRARAASR